MRCGRCLSSFRRLPIERLEVRFLFCDAPAHHAAIELRQRNDGGSQSIHGKPVAMTAQPTGLGARARVARQSAKVGGRQEHNGPSIRSTSTAGVKSSPTCSAKNAACMASSFELASTSYSRLMVTR